MCVPVDYSEGSVWTQLVQVYCRTVLLCVGGGGDPDWQEGVLVAGAHGHVRSARALQGWAAIRPHVRVGEVSSSPDPVS